MKISNPLMTWLSILAAGLLVGCGGSDSAPNSFAEEVEVLFNGTDLTGWSGNSENWSVVDGTIVGTTTDDNPLPYNQFLIYEGDPVEDFELTAELKLTSDGNNSGIQYRAQLRPDLGDNVVSGYQCDMHPFVWANGMLYDEKGRGIIAKRGMKAVVTPEGKAMQVGDLPMTPEFNTGEWSTYKITVKGNHHVHEVNGVQTVDVYDHQEAERELSGVIAFQIHKGPAMKVEIRNVTLKRLAKSEVTAPEATPVPADAKPVNPPKPKAAPKGKGKGKGPAKAKAKEGQGKAKAKSKAKEKAPAQ
ncbi:MAG: DUF1080 domain-containing protein [Verrucomicrobiales bacterium]|nr:DUF1080 domain-containing protein [Verrucomicrobiales bacterium]